MTHHPAGCTDDALAALAPVLEQMPDPAGRAQAAALEDELAAAFGVRHVITVSSGTAAGETGIAACQIGTGDEILIPAATVVMSVAAIVAAGARPVFVDADTTSEPGRSGVVMDISDLTAKITPRTRAIMPVHLAGRCGNLDQVQAVAAEARLWLIPDACQAQGSRYRGQHVGTISDIGFHSTKDGKVLACGEGGYLLTNNADLAARAAAYRSHWQTPAPGAPASSRLGRNYRLAEPLAALARHRLRGFDAALAQRRRQTHALIDLVGDVPGLAPIPAGTDEEPNGYSALWHVTLPAPRAFTTHLAARGVLNSVGSFGLRAAHQHPACQPLNPAPCPAAANAIDALLAVPVTSRHSETDLARIAATIRAEARTWKIYAFPRGAR